jgi:hypothetical protein
MLYSDLLLRGAADVLRDVGLDNKYHCFDEA